MRPTHTPNEPNECDKHDLQVCHTRLTNIPKEPYINGKRAQQVYQMRPTHTPNEPNERDKQALQVCQTRPTYTPKEPYVRGKRALHM